MGITRIHVNKPERQVSFARSQDLLEEVMFLEKARKWPITKLLKLLITLKMDSVSITVDKPYFYFYARRGEGTISFIIQSGDVRTEFEIPIPTIADRITGGRR